MLLFRLRFVSAALVAAGALVAFGHSAQTAHAQTSLTSGNTVTPAPTIGFLSTGAQVGTTQTATFDFQNTQNGSNAFGNRISGTIYSAAFYATGNAGSPIDFYYQVQLNATTNTSVSQVSVGEFGAFTTSVGQTTTDIDGGGPFASGTVASTSTARSADGSGLFFNFATFTAGNSYTQVVRTNATTIVNGSGSAQGTGVSGTATGNVLVTGSVAGPEPGSLVLMGTGLMSATGIVVRRRRTAKK